MITQAEVERRKDVITALKASVRTLMRREAAAPEPVADALLLLCAALVLAERAADQLHAAVTPGGAA